MRNVATIVGRRIDPQDEENCRFPQSKIPDVTHAIETTLMTNDVEMIVCSAACGTDLIALEIAERLGILAHIVLPMEILEFRETSVTDRPGDWSNIFDRVIARAQKAKSLIILPPEKSNDLSFHKANEVILKTAIFEANPANPLSIIVWEGQSRGTADFTDDFRKLADENDLHIVEIKSC